MNLEGRMKTIFKYELETIGRNAIRMPIGAKILTAQIQFGRIHIWAEVDDSNGSEEVLIDIFGTGFNVAEDMGISGEYIGTVQENNGSYVWHIYKTGPLNCSPRAMDKSEAESLLALATLKNDDFTYCVKHRKDI